MVKSITSTITPVTLTTTTTQDSWGEYKKRMKKDPETKCRNWRLNEKKKKIQTKYMIKNKTIKKSKKNNKYKKKNSSK